jgi:hypothetical protein
MSISEALDDLTFDQEDDGVLVRKQLDRVVLAKGAWATVMFLYQELDRASGTFRAPKMAIVRFKKWNGVYRKQSAFNLSGEAQARELTQVFERWYVKMRELAPGVQVDEDADEDADADGDGRDDGDAVGAEG